MGVWTGFHVSLVSALGSRYTSTYVCYAWSYPCIHELLIPCRKTLTLNLKQFVLVQAPKHNTNMVAAGGVQFWMTSYEGEGPECDFGDQGLGLTQSLSLLESSRGMISVVCTHIKLVDNQLIRT